MSRRIHAMVLAGLLTGVSTIGAALPPPLPPLTESEVALKPAASRFTVDRAEHDFGTILDNEPKEVVFHFTNTGVEPLIIGEVKSTCGCTVPELVKKIYQPGEQGEVIVRYNPHGKRGNDARSVTLETNDSTQPSVKLNIKAHVKQLVVFEPTLLQFGQVDKGKGKTMEFYVAGRTEDFQVTLATTTMPDVFTVELGQTEVREIGIDKEQLRATRLIIKLREDAPVGMHTAELTMRTNDGRAPVERTQVLSQVLGDIQVTPPRISLGRIERGQSFTREFRVQSRSGQPFHISQIEARDTTADVSFEFMPEDAKNPTSWKVVMSGRAHPQERRILGQLLIRTDVRSEETIEVRYNGFINVGTEPGN